MTPECMEELARQIGELADLLEIKCAEHHNPDNPDRVPCDDTCKVIGAVQMAVHDALAPLYRHIGELRIADGECPIHGECLPCGACENDPRPMLPTRPAPHTD